MSTFKRSKGAVQVLDTAPAPPPATRCLHHIPVCLSSTVNSSGTVKFSPTSKICKRRRYWEMLHQSMVLLKFYCSLLAPGTEVQNLLIPSQQLIYSHQLLCLATGAATARTCHRENWVLISRFLSRILATAEHLSTWKYCRYLGTNWPTAGSCMAEKLHLSRTFRARSLLNLLKYYLCTDKSRKDGCLWNQVLVSTGPEPAGAGHWQELLEVHTKRTPSASCSTAVVITCASSCDSDMWQDYNRGQEAIELQGLQGSCEPWRER